MSRGWAAIIEEESRVSTNTAAAQVLGYSWEVVAGLAIRMHINSILDIFF